MKLLVLSASDLRAALPMGDAIAAMKRAFSAQSGGAASAPQRGIVAAESGTALVMGACIPELGLAAKIVSVFPGNAALGKAVINGLVVVLDRHTGEPVALCDGTFLTAWRTGAASGAATELLARPTIRIGAIIGCGAQARTQALAIDSARDLEAIRVFGPRREACEQFVSDMQPGLGARLEIAATPAEAIRDAGVVCAATSSHTPVFDGRDLMPGAHINAVGSFQHSMRELDVETISRARIYVDSREAALAEAGELVHAIEQGATRAEDWIEIGEAFAGRASARQSEPESEPEITLFKSVGLAVQDVAAAAAALEGARSLGLGATLDL